MLFLIVTDGKRGHENQSRTLSSLFSAEARLLEIAHLPFALEVFFRFLFLLFGYLLMKPPVLSVLLRLMFKSSAYESINAIRESLPFPDGEVAFVISTGTLTAIPGILFSRLLNLKHIHLCRPSMVPLRYFDLVILPSHDVSPGKKLPPNVLTFALALSRASEEETARCMENLVLRTGKTWEALSQGQFISFHIGGESANFEMPAEEIVSALEAILLSAERAGAKLLLTTSRRTPEKVENAVQAALRRSLNLLELAVWGRSDLFNPVPAFLKLAKVVVVTEDSISMLSEAILGGHMPIVLKLPAKRFSRKFNRFKETLTSSGLARYCDSKELPKAILEALSKSGRKAEHRLNSRLGLDDLLSKVKEVLKS